jgi:hypothetical protein
MAAASDVGKRTEHLLGRSSSLNLSIKSIGNMSSTHKSVNKTLHTLNLSTKLIGNMSFTQRHEASVYN